MSNPQSKTPEWVSATIAALALILSVVSLIAQSCTSNKVNDYQKQRDTVAGYSIEISSSAVTIKNSKSEPLLNAAYWVLGIHGGKDGGAIMQERFSKLSPIPPCKQFIISIKDLGITTGDGMPNAAFLIYRDTPTTWMGVSNEGAMETSNEKTDDPVAALKGLDAYNVMGDTILEGVDGEDTSDFPGGTGPANRDTALYSVGNDIKARMSSIPCAR